jgi:hypothetical protein
MKKILLIFGFICLIVSVYAQNQATVVDRGNVKEFTYTGAASDTVNGAAGSAYVYWEPGFKEQYLYHIEAELDEISGSANGFAVLEYSNDNSHWNLIDSLTTVNTSTEAQSDDGTVMITDLTGIIAKYLRVKVTESTTGEWDINYIIVRMVGKNE